MPKPPRARPLEKSHVHVHITLPAACLLSVKSERQIYILKNVRFPNAQ